MKLYEPTQSVGVARIAVSEALMTVLGKHVLTPAETISILHGVMSQYINFALRYERHGNYEKKADEA